VIGKEGKNIAADAAMSHVFGYTVANDVSARDWQLVPGKNANQWLLGKSMDAFCPLGPWITTTEDVGEDQVHAMPIACRVNGRTLQESNTEQLVFKIREIIAFSSK
jgi:2-keto-4-pentenoate hydratase/2-oxohepta-3-ene-1,7-dioic acid hydratase in catechol pathway